MVAPDAQPELAPAAPAPEFPPPVKTTIEWLRGRFAAWYAEHPVPLPDRFTRREFGFILWPERPGPPPFLRHRAYGDAARLHAYMARRGVHSAYYSTAYYRRPGEMRMADKQWLAAELIFDLDADHLPEAEAAKAAGEPMPVEEQLRRVKGHFIRLVDDFLLGDFGLDERDVWFTFSGGRGYHAHVTAPAFMGLDARARREIVDYVTGKVPAEKGSGEPDMSAFLHEVRQNVGTERYPRLQSMLATHSQDAPGWQGRLTRSLADALETHVLNAPQKDAVAWLTSFDGIGAKSAQAVVEGLTSKRLDLIRRGSLGLDASGAFRKISKRLLAQHALPLSKGETDEPVTADVKRLIRLPGSLHGKSGLQVVTLRRDELDGFEPLRDAVAFPLDETVAFVARHDAEVSLGGQAVPVTGGEETEVPVAHAVWWCARQQGTVRPPQP